MTEEASYAELADYLEATNYGQEVDGVHLAPTDAALAAKALRALAAACKETAPNQE